MAGGLMKGGFTMSGCGSEGKAVVAEVCEAAVGPSRPYIGLKLRC